MSTKITEEEYAKAREELFYHFLVVEFIPRAFDFTITNRYVREAFHSLYKKPISPFQARTHIITPLLQERLITKYKKGFIDDEGRVHCIHGYTFTIKAYRSEVAEKARENAEEEWSKYVREVMEDGENL